MILYYADIENAWKQMKLEYVFLHYIMTNYVHIHFELENSRLANHATTGVFSNGIRRNHKPSFEDFARFCVREGWKPSNTASVHMIWNDAILSSIAL